MLARSFLAVVVLLAGCTAIRPLDPVDAGSTGVDASSVGDANVDAALAADTGLDAFAPDAAPDDAGAGDASADDAAVDAPVTSDTGCPPEMCGGGDEDCDGMIDESDAIDAMTYYPDVDLDNWGDDAGAIMACTPPTSGRWVMRGGDCDDMQRTVNPGRGENCNARDDDCDGSIDEGLSGCATSCTAATYGGHTYQFCMSARAQTDAASRCAPGHLVDIGDAGENTFVEMTATAAGLGLGGLGQGVWIGLEQSATMPTQYEWSDGSVASYLAWDVAMGEPNHSGTCVRMRTTSGLWADNACGNSLPYVCETP